MDRETKKPAVLLPAMNVSAALFFAAVGVWTARNCQILLGFHPEEEAISIFRFVRFWHVRTDRWMVGSADLLNRVEGAEEAALGFRDSARSQETRYMHDMPITNQPPESRQNHENRICCRQTHLRLDRVLRWFSVLQLAKDSCECCLVCPVLVEAWLPVSAELRRRLRSVHLSLCRRLNRTWERFRFGRKRRSRALLSFVSIPIIRCFSAKRYLDFKILLEIIS